VPITTIDKQSNYFKNNSRSFSLASNTAALTALTMVTRTLVDDDSVSSQAGQGEEHSQDGTLRQKESIVMDEDDGDEDEDEDDILATSLRVTTISRVIVGVTGATLSWY
jgi:hypothetical protein